jgi:predicted metal-dependent phosphoesterase TrpH
VIDLHLHTTASDGRDNPRELVDRAVAAGVTVVAVTDHDTTAATAEVRTRAHERGIEAATGIEITAVESGRDVHVLGYFLDPNDAALEEFLARQRAIRLARVEAIAARLASLGMPIDVRSVVDAGRRPTARSVGRPLIARAMIAAGYVADTREAFDRWIGRDGPAFVARTGASTEAVIAIIHAAGGLASLAHPGRTGIDARIPALRDAGLDALEVYHTDHGETQRDRYGRLAHRLGLLITGGSDYHGDPAHGVVPGGATLPFDHWRRLEAARHRHAPR